MRRRPLYLAALLGATLMAPCLAQESWIAGEWTCNMGRVRRDTPGNRVIRIEQDGRRLSFANDRGQVARGRFVERDVMFASDWEYGEKAHLGINVDGKFFRIKDAMAQFNMPEGQAWNFILWEGGTICFKSGP